MTSQWPALLLATEGAYDAILVSLDLEGSDGLRLCSQLRSLDRTRSVPTATWRLRSAPTGAKATSATMVN